MNTKTKKTLGARPIRFARLRVDSYFRIFAEPSRGIQRSPDSKVYLKKCEAYSEDSADSEHCIILMPEDLVQPLTRGHS